MRNLLIVVGAVMLLTVLAAASEKSDAMVPVQQFVDGFNQHNPDKSLALMAIVRDGAGYPRPRPPGIPLENGGPRRV